MPPPGSSGLIRNIEWVRKSAESAPIPSLTVYQMISTSGVAASTKASPTRVVNSRSIACRRPSTLKLTAVCTTMNSSTANTTNPARPAKPVVAQSSSVTRTAATANAGSAYAGSLRPRRDGPAAGVPVRGSGETAISGPLPLLPADGQLCGEVHRERDDEQAQARGDQRARPDVARLAVLERDVRGERDAAGLGEVPADLVHVGQHDGDRERLAERAAQAEDRGGDGAGLSERQHR